MRELVQRDPQLHKPWLEAMLTLGARKNSCHCGWPLPGAALYRDWPQQDTMLNILKILMKTSTKWEQLCWNSGYNHK